MRMNVINEYTYTLETIVQAGRNKMAVTSVPIRTNPELRKSRLFHSMFGYVKKSMLTIGRAYMMYKPLAVFSAIAAVFGTTGVGIGIRYLYRRFNGKGQGNVQSLIFSSMSHCYCSYMWGYRIVSRCDCRQQKAFAGNPV